MVYYGLHEEVFRDLVTPCCGPLLTGDILRVRMEYSLLVSPAAWHGYHEGNILHDVSGDIPDIWVLQRCSRLAPK
jgi:hypothetical protein